MDENLQSRVHEHHQIQFSVLPVLFRAGAEVLPFFLPVSLDIVTLHLNYNS